MAERSNYNERFAFADPGDVQSGSRSTLYRLRKRALASKQSSYDVEHLFSKENLSYCESECLQLFSHENELEQPELEFIDGIISDDCDNTYQIVNNSEDDILEPVSLAPDNDSESEVAELYNDCDNYPLSAEVESYTDDDDAYEEEEDTSTDMMRYGSQRHLPLYDGAPLSEFTSSLMIMKFKMRHNLTDQCLADLLHLLRLHCPVPNHCPSSLYLFKKNFVETKFPINYHYFCSACLQSVNITDDSCSNNLCMSKFEKIGSRSSFIEIPIEPQIQTLFKSEEFYSALLSHLDKRCCNDSGSYSDIYDGQLYKQLGSFPLQLTNISLSFNTDGVPVFKSSGFSFWPIFLLINELPYHSRIAKENVILGGLWYGLVKPDMSLFLKPVVTTLKKMHLEGISVSFPNGEQAICRAALLCAVLDLPARAIVTNFVQYNGYWGCGHCLQKGVRVKVGAQGSVQTYPYDEDNPCGPARDHKQTCEAASEAIRCNIQVQGVKGPSWLTTVPQFDLIKGMSFDYMHCVLLGICRLLLRLWLQSSHHEELWYIGTKVTLVDSRLCSIMPPSEIKRTPRSLGSTMKFWKAHELRAWLLHYSPAVLYQILPQAFYQHHLLLVEAIYLLLQDKVLESDIEQSFQLLKHYVFMFASLYGDSNMTSNVHGLLHLPECVRNLGPLWAHSCFPFEEANRDLLKLFHGSQGIEKQIVDHMSLLKILPTLAQSFLQPHSKEQAFYNKLSTKNCSSKRREIDLSMSLLGSPHNADLLDQERDLFLKVGINPPCEVMLYPSLQLAANKRIVVAQSRSRSIKRNNCCLAFLSGYGLLTKIIVYKEPTGGTKCYLLVMKMNPAPMKICTDEITNAQFHKHFIAFYPPRLGEQVLISPNEVVDKCVYINMESYYDVVFVSLLHNCKELE